MSQVVRAFGPGGPPEANVILKSMPHPVILVDRDMRIDTLKRHLFAQNAR